MKRQEAIIERNKAKELANAVKTKAAFVKLNTLVEKHGVSGVLFVAMGGRVEDGKH